MSNLRSHWDMLSQDLRYTARTLVRAPGFALATILVTALGVGANTATFSVASLVLIEPLPFPDPETLVRICEGPREGGGWGCNNQMSAANYRDVVAMNTSFAVSGVFRRTAVNVVEGGEPLRVPAALVTPEVLSVLGVPPLIGRAFDGSAGDAGERTAIISFGLWQSRFGGQDGVVGSTLMIDGMTYVVIGVMPRQFRFPADETQLWMPLILREADFANRAGSALEGVARLRPGVTFAQARADLTSIAVRLAREYPETNAERGFSFFRPRDEMSPVYRTMLLALCGASVCMLLLTCANLANLLLARGAGRARELAVRAALGAGRARLVRQMLTESVALALVGGAAGALVAAIALPLLARLVPPTLPIATQPAVDMQVLVLAAASAALTGVGFGLIPALRAGARRTGFAALREGARGSGRRSRLRTILVATEVGLSVVLLVAAGLLIRSMWRVQAVDPGFDTGSVLTVRTALPANPYGDQARRADFYRRVTAKVRELPGVESAAYTSGLPLVMTGGMTPIRLPGEARLDRTRIVSLRLITPQFFETLRVPMLHGRDVSETDTRDRPLVAVVSESFVRRYWPGTGAIGRTFEARGQWRTVIGVAADIRVRGLERSSEPQLYVPFDQPPDPVGDIYLPKDLVVRSSRQDPGLASAIREIVRQVDPRQPVTDVRMLADVVGDQTLTRRVQLRVLGALAVLALLLTAVGIHALLAFTVAQRDREIGVRLALGASPGSVARMIMSEGVRIALLGVIPGLLVAYVGARGMSTLLFGVRTDDPMTFSVVAAVCCVTAVAACVRPALRAAGIHPMSVLRSD